jgi:hypothetical protein
MTEMPLIEEVPMQGVKSKSCKAFWFCPFELRLGCLALVFAVGFACIAQDARPSPTSASTGTAQAAGSKPQNAKDDKQQAAVAGEGARKKQIADESTQLLTMALDLKAEVDKTTKDTLSINVIKKADQIEKLAKSVKEKMNQSSGS